MVKGWELALEIGMLGITTLSLQPTVSVTLLVS